jgi:hypothetical protein
MIVDGKWVIGQKRYLFILSGFDGQDLYEMAGKELKRTPHEWDYPILLHTSYTKFEASMEEFFSLSEQALNDKRSKTVEAFLSNTGYRVLYMDFPLCRLEMLEEELLTHDHVKVRLATLLYMEYRKKHYARV